MNSLPAMVARVVKLLADRDYEALEAMTHGRRVSSEQLAAAVADYGRTLVPLPETAMNSLDVVKIADSDPDTFSVVVDLWTVEEGRSDLSMELLVVESYGCDLEIEIMDVRVL